MNDQKDDLRASRDNESREGEVIHDEYDDNWEEPSLLDTSKIPPRPGYVQRWCRTEINGKDDTSNINRKINQGWKPRTATSVAKGDYVPTIKFGKSNVIGMQGLVLMERPVELHERHGRSIRRDTANQMRSVDESMFNTHRANSGMTAPERTGSSRATRGKDPRVAED